MRILFINTLDASGGAAVITKRLMNGLSKTYNTENYLLVKIKQGSDNHTKQILTNAFAINFEKAIDRLTRPAGLLYQYFPFSSSAILKETRIFNPDVINIHNTHGAYFPTSLIAKISKLAPVVWTLHDMWSFTANASHSFGNMSWKYLRNDPELTKIPPAIGINTGAWLLKQKKKIYAKSDLAIVTPSLWLKELAEQSPVFDGKEIFQIYNGVDTGIYRPLNKNAGKTKLGLNNGCKTLMFSSHFLDKNNPWKGGKDLLTILERINLKTRDRINLIITGEGKPAELDNLSNFNVFYQGYIKDEFALADCMNAADLFIYPTRADTLANVLVEAIACGTPCITFDIGGNREIVHDNVNGIIINPFDFDAFALETLQLLHNEARLAQFSEQAAAIAGKVFRQEDMITRYYNVFENAVNKPN